MFKKKVATWAEEEVRKKLEADSHLLVAQNLRHIGFEIDLATIKEQTLVITEVKARSFKSRKYCELENLLGWKKKEALKKGAMFLLNRLDFRKISWVQFDLVLVFYRKKVRTKQDLLLEEIKYYRNIF